MFTVGMGVVEPRKTPKLRLFSCALSGMPSVYVSSDVAKGVCGA